MYKLTRLHKLRGEVEKIGTHWYAAKPGAVTYRGFDTWDEAREHAFGGTGPFMIGARDG